MRDTWRFDKERLRRTIKLALIGGVAAWTLASCAAAFDMSGEHIDPPGPEWGVVIGSVLVQLDTGTAGMKASGHDAAGGSYVFDMVQIQPADPRGEDPYAQRYNLEAKAGEERLFISRVRPGRYLIRNFREERVAGVAGDLDLIFTAEPGEVSYIGRVVVDIPRRVTSGKAYRFSVDNVREATLARLPERHAPLAQAAVDRPLQARATPTP